MCISLERAVELDKQKNAQSSFSGDVYRQPVLSEKITEPIIRPSSFAPTGSSRALAMPKLEIVAHDDMKDADSGKMV